MNNDFQQIIWLTNMEKIKPNFAKLARQFNCDPRTIKRYYEYGEKVFHRKPRYLLKILDSYKDFIIGKLKVGASAKSIHSLLQEKGVTCGYTTVKNFCKSYHTKKQRHATIRYETNPGLQAQVDWKENFTLYNKSGESFTINLFLIVLGYSRYKYIELTLNKQQPTLFRCLCNAFKCFGGVPKEILFDNMRTVVDRSRTQFNKPVFNPRFMNLVRISDLSHKHV